MEKENRMGTMPMGKLIISMSLPIVISMLVQAMYNIVDSIFVSRYSADAFAAISYAFPAQNLLIGLATGIGVGMNALLSKSLGEKNQSRVNKAAENGVFLAFLSFVLFLIFGLFFSESFIAFQTATPEVIAYGKTYLTICCSLSFGIFGEIILERLLQATGRSFYTMITQGVGAIVNIILDPIFIFGYLGLPEMGIAGAAYATVIGQVIAFILAIIFHYRVNHEIQLNIKKFRPDGPVIGRICAVGIPSVIMVGIGSVMTTTMNKILNGFSDLAVSVFGAYFKLQSFIFMPIFGLNNGVIPVMAYNFGAGRRRRMMSALKIALISAVSIMTLGLAAMQLFPAQLLSFFGANAEMIAMGTVALRIISLSFIFAGVCIVIISIFQALGHGMYSMYVSFARQIIVLIPVAYLFSLTGDVNKVWLAFPIAEVVSVIICVLMFIRLYKKTISKIPE